MVSISFLEEVRWDWRVESWLCWAKTVAGKRRVRFLLLFLFYAILEVFVLPALFKTLFSLINLALSTVCSFKSLPNLLTSSQLGGGEETAEEW